MKKANRGLLKKTGCVHSACHRLSPQHKPPTSGLNFDISLDIRKGGVFEKPELLYGLLLSNLTRIQKSHDNGSEATESAPITQTRVYKLISIGNSTVFTRTCPLMSISAYFWRSARTISTWPPLTAPINTVSPLWKDQKPRWRDDENKKTLFWSEDYPRVNINRFFFPEKSLGKNTISK